MERVMMMPTKAVQELTKNCGNPMRMDSRMMRQ